MKYKISEKQVFSHRPKPFYFITTNNKDEFTPAKVKSNLLMLKNCGFNGFILFNKPPVGFREDTYLNDVWFDMVKTFAIEAKKLKLEMWINDGFDYPPGNVGGQLQKIAPDLFQQHIVLENDTPTVKNSDWGFPAWENPRSGELFNMLVHDKYKKVVGDFFGDPIKGFFTDGDNRRVLPPVMFDENHPCRNYFPWATDFEESFKEIYGYDIMPFMKDVLKRADIPQAVDYWNHAGFLYRRWLNNNKKWLHSNGLLYTGHTGDSSPLLYKDAPRCSALTESRFSDLESIFDYPGTDQELLALDGGKHMVVKNWYSPKAIWGNTIHTPRMTDYSDVHEDMRAKQAGSTAFMYGKKEVMCEMFAASNFDVSPSELKQIAAFQIMQGVTFIVEHAFHYRYYDVTKYFAPPEFSERGMIGNYVKELNTELAKITYMMTKGKSVCPVALLDPTEAVWRNNIRSDEYFEAFAKLNRSTCGYTIIDADKILNGNFDFKVVVIAGWNPDESLIAKFKEKGLAIVSEKEIDKIDSIVNPPIKYVGEGTPHFVRKIIDGQEFTFIANIENEGAIKGKISAYGKEKDILLYQGDIRYISKKYSDIPDVIVHGEKVADIPQEVSVDFLAPNYLALERFEKNGNVFVKSDDAKSLDFKFACKNDIAKAKLYMPKKIADVSKVSIDGNVLSACDGAVYDEPYSIFDLPTLSVGDHVITFDKDEPYNWFDRIFILGDFDASVDSDKTEFKKDFSVYNISVFIPEKATVTLSSRRNTLKTDTSWALQGQPFYSGKADYKFDITLPQKGLYRLVLPKVRDVVWVNVNNKSVGKLYLYPYELVFKGKKGVNNIKLTIANSGANNMEFYLEDSGLLQGGYIEKV